MKPANANYITMLQTHRQFLFAELYQIELRDGVKDYFCDLDIPTGITYNGNLYKSTTLRFEGLRQKISVGFEVDEQELKISAYPGETLASVEFFEGVWRGLLDGATITRFRAFWVPATGTPFGDFSTIPIEVLNLFVGKVSTITKIGRTHVELKVKSPLSVLQANMPRNTYQPSCQWTLYDAGCKVNRALFTSSFTVGSIGANGQHVHPAVLPIAPVTGADGHPFYGLGRMRFTSGILSGQQFMIGTNDANFFSLMFPLPDLPSPGDTFDASAGCTKAEATCEAKFNNLINFRGFNRVPPIVVSV